MASKELSSFLIAASTAGSNAFDVALFGHVRFCMAQDALNDFLVCTQLIQIRRNATPEPMPAIPFQLDSLRVDG
jgi:hypothetical protein